MRLIPIDWEQLGVPAAEDKRWQIQRPAGWAGRLGRRGVFGAAICHWLLKDVRAICLYRAEFFADGLSALAGGALRPHAKRKCGAFLVQIFFFVFSILYCKKKNGIKHFETGTLLEIFSILYIVCIGSEFHREVGSWWIRFKLCEIPRRWIAGGSDAHVNWLVWLIFSKGLRLIDDLKWELCWGTNKLNYRGSDDFENWSSWWIRFKLSECVVYFALSHLSVKLIQRIWSLWPFCGLAVGTGVVVSFILFFCFHFFSFLFFFF